MKPLNVTDLLHDWYDLDCKWQAPIWTVVLMDVLKAFFSPLWLNTVS